MARLRTPTNILKLRGADKKHPDRMRERKDEPQDDRPVGDPPKEFDADQVRAWQDIVTACIPGVLTGSDRLYVETASRLLAMVRCGTATSADYTRWEAMLGKMGLNPADRSRISVPKKGGGNPFEGY